jgi:hypothetical protein
MQLRLPWAPRPETRNEVVRSLLLDIPRYGDSIREKAKGSLRVALQNINGMQSRGQQVGCMELDGIYNYGIDIMGMVEINLNCSLDVRSNFMAAANLRLKPARVAMSSAWALDEGYMPGGTAMVAHGNVCGRIHQKGADTLGRFTWMALRGRSGTGVFIVTAYRVCQTAGTDAGDNTAYMREYTSMREAGIEKPDPRNSILDDISDLLLEWGQKGYHPLVLMDANSTMDERNMAEFTKRHGLHDLISDLHPGDPPPTYGRGSSRIDLTLGDAHVRRAVSKCGALAMHEGVSPSDHTMQFIDFDEKQLFGNDSFKPMAGFAREFRLYDTKKKEKFQEKLDEIYKHQRIPDRVKALADALEEAESITPELINDYQTLDSEIVEAILSAAAATGRKDFGYQRSPALCKALRYSHSTAQSYSVKHTTR